MNTINLQLENRVGILEKISNVLTRNRVYLTKLDFTTDPLMPMSMVSISADFSLTDAEKLMKQFHRIVEVRDIKLNQ